MRMGTAHFSGHEGVAFGDSGGICSYKRVKGRSHTVDKRLGMHPHKPLNLCMRRRDRTRGPPPKANLRSHGSGCVRERWKRPARWQQLLPHSRESERSTSPLSLVGHDYTAMG